MHVGGTQPGPSRKSGPAFRDRAHRTQAAAAFVRDAHRYDVARPTYPATVAELLAGCGEVCDAGAGTGKLTQMLHDVARATYAFDPSDDMVRVLRAQLPDVPVWRATAEATGLRGGAVDALACAQTWHWVDAEAASREADRVVRDGGALLLCWNTLAVRHPWVLRLSRIMHSGDVQREGFYPTVAAPWRLETELREEWVQMIAVEPKESPILNGGDPGPHKIQGIGAGFVPDILDRSVIDEIVKINSATAIETARALARNEGIPGGISSGAAIAAALQIGKRPEAAGKTILAIVPSFSERYLSTALFEGI